MYYCWYHLNITERKIVLFSSVVSFYNCVILSFQCKTFFLKQKEMQIFEEKFKCSFVNEVLKRNNHRVLLPREIILLNI